MSRDTIRVKGILPEEAQDKCLNTATAHDQIRVYEIGCDGNDVLLFSGIVTQLKVRREYGGYHIEIEGMSYTYLLDTKLKSRSFQDQNQKKNSAG